MINISYNGDDYISGFEHRLWNFTYTVLQKFGCPIQFKVQGPDVRIKLNQIITFFVPVGREDVVEYIVQEWEDEERKSSEDGDWFWGTEINIIYFNGPEFYTDKEIIRDISQNMMLYLKAKVEGKDVDISDFSSLDTKH